MHLNDALNKVIEIGIEAAKRDYAGLEDAQKLAGAMLGFNECRERTVPELTSLLSKAAIRMVEAHREQAQDYWYWRCRHAEIEWVCNVISAILMNEGMPVITPPTARGALMAARIVGVCEEAA